MSVCCASSGRPSIEGRHTVTTNENQNEGQAEAKPRYYPPGTYLRSYDVLQLLPISLRTLKRWEKQGRMPIIRAGERLILYRRSDIERMLEKMTVRAV